MRIPIFQIRRVSYFSAAIAQCFSLGLSLRADPTNCVSPPAGLVSWWQAETNAFDSTSTNHGTLGGNTAYGIGRVGSAFVFDGSGDGVQLGNPGSLQLQDMTIEGWIKRTSTSAVSFGSFGNGVLLGYGTSGYGFYLDPSGHPALSKIGISAVTSSASITDTNYHHLAVTKSGSSVIFYVDGVAYPASAYNPGFVFNSNVAIGAKGDGFDNSFYGRIDEIAIYNRALSASEVQGIYNAGNFGKCVTVTPPVIFSPPANQTVVVGETASFAIVAGGTLPLTYQWSFNGTNLAGETGSSLLLTNVQFANAGTYSVGVSNSAGTTNVGAILSVNPPPPCTPPPSQLVGWWRAESNASDSGGTNNGSLGGNTAYGAGRVGTAFAFDGNGDGIQLGNVSSLQLQNMTIETWIKRSSTSFVSFGSYGNGVLFGYGSGGYGLYLDPSGQLALSKIGESATTSSASVTDTAFHHVAVTKSASTVVFYVDGIAYPASAYDPGFVFSTGVAIGAKGDGFDNSFFGSIDELAVYSRALAASEIQSIYAAGVSGKCIAPTPPVILSAPANQTVFAGGNASFTVVAGGTQPLTYQWSFNGTNLDGQTGSSLTITNAQAGEAGVYSVVVSNFLGTNGASATLTVVPPSPCASLPAGLVSWWRGQGDALDFVGGNHGTVVGDATYAPGWVGSSFVFDGSGDAVQLGNPANLRLQDFTIETWLKRNSTSLVSYGSYGNGVIFGYGNGGYGLYLDPNGYPALSQIGSSAVSPSVSITDTSIHHVAVTKSGSNVVFYIDGAAYPAGPYDPGFVFTSDVAIGAKGDSLDNSFYGLVDELAVYNRALAGSEIQAIYSAASSGKCATPTAPSILSQPTDRTVVIGSSTTFQVVAGGTPPLAYQWKLGGSDILGATNSVYTRSNVQTNDAGVYSVSVSNSVSATNSLGALLTVIDLGPNFFDDFEPGIDVLQWAEFGGAVLATNAGGSLSGSNSLWFAGAGSRYAATRPLDTTSGGVVEFYLRIANGNSYPWEKADLPGEGIVLEYTTNGSSNWTQIARYDTPNYFNWTFNSMDLPSAAQAPGTRIRWRQLSNSGNASDHWALDDVAVIVGSRPPRIVTQPISQTVIVGANVTFTVNATGTAPLVYQWQFNGTNLVGAVGTSLTLTNVQMSDAGGYSVTVSNTAGATNSSIASLTVNPPPPCAPPPSGLVSWWQAENNALDTSSTNNGVLVGNTAFGVGRVAQAFVFDGNGDGVQLGNPAGLRLQDFTIETWIKRASASIVSFGSFGNGVLFGYGSGGYGFYLDPNGRPALSKIGVSATTASVSITDTNLHHVAVTKSGSTVVFYVDGAAYPAVGYNPGFVFTSNIAIGAKGDSFDNSFYGSVDELSFYDRALSASEVQGIYNAGSLGKCVTPVAPFIVSPPTNQTVVLGANAVLSVAAGGTQPLSYQWRFNGADITNATGSTLTLTNVQFAQAGNYSVVISNNAGSTNSAAAALTVVFPPATVRIQNVNAIAGGSVTLPVTIVANGNENALSFSLNFNTQHLAFTSVELGGGASNAFLLPNTSQAANGKVGIALALSTEGTFTPGTQEVARVTFESQIVLGTQAVVSAVSFADQPIVKRLADAQAQALSANYSNGTVTLTPSDLEADVAPRPGGDRNLDILDWVQVGRFVAALDTPSTGGEFQRADCAPRTTLGDGQFKVTDWVQAGRYAAGLDPLTLAGGPSSGPSFAFREPQIGSEDGPQQDPGMREVRVSNATAIQGLTVTVPVILQSLGDENALGFSVTFDPAVFQYYSASKGSAAASGTLNVNPNQAGRVGLTLALPTGSTFAEGAREVARVTLKAIAPVSSNVPVALGDQPVLRAISDSRALELSAVYTAGSVFVNPLPSLSVAQTNGNAVLSWPAWADGFNLQSKDSLSSGNWSNVVGTLQTNGSVLSLTLPISGESKYFRLHHP